MGSLAPEPSQKNPLTASHISELRELLKQNGDDSRLMEPEDEGYEDSIKRWSMAAVKRAPAVLYPSSANTIAFVLPYIVKQNIDLAIKGGGHSTSGASSTSTGLVIDLHSFHQTVVDPSARTIRAGGGTNWGEVDAALLEHGLATVGGTVSDTGVGGLTLGGGYGWLSGQHGLVIDNLLSATVVLTTGEIVTASKTENEDLFWGLRGAGQNFGVVTEFVLQAFKQDEVWAGMLIFPPPLLASVVDVFNRIILPMSGKGAGGFGFARPPPAGGQVVIVTPIIYFGTEEEGQAGFQELLDLGPIVNAVETRTYASANTMINPPPGLRASLKGATFTLPVRPEFAQKVLDSYITFTESIPDAAASLTLFEVFSPTRVCELASNKSMAFANRGPHFNGMIGPMWTSPESDAACRQWARDASAIFMEELEDEKKKGGAEDVEKDAVMIYGNYEHYDEKGKDIFGVNYARLRDLKRRYDPENVFDKLFPVNPAGA